MSEQRPAATPHAANGNEHAYTAFVRPRDPLLLRDAHPFAAEPGARAATLPWPMPRTFAGAVRAWHHERVKGGAQFPKEENIDVHGPLLAAQASAGDPWEVYLPVPLDVVPWREEEGNLLASTLRPKAELHGMIKSPERLAEGEGCDLPAAPAGWEDRVDLHPLRVDEEIKPAKSPALWRLDDLVRWLNTPGRDFDSLLETRDGSQQIRGIDYPGKETRTHVAIDPTTGTGRDGHLFTTEALAFHDEPSKQPAAALLGRVCSPEAWPSKPRTGPLPLGGERRVTTLTITDTADRGGLWPAPTFPEDAEAIRHADGICLYLATPAIFRQGEHGWLPAWVKDGAFPGTGGLKLGLTLVGVATSRPVAVSGWRYTSPIGGQGARSQRGEPRGTVLAVPAGSIYFFSLNGGATLSKELCDAVWKALWLRPVSDSPLDRAAGFGLALPGLWRWAN